MTLRIDRVGERVRLSGELRSEHVCQVKAEIDQCGPRRVLDLEEVDRVDVEAIRFLNSCETQGVSVLNVSAYQGVDGAGTQAATAGTVRATDVEQRKNSRKEGSR